MRSPLSGWFSSCGLAFLTFGLQAVAADAAMAPFPYAVTAPSCKDLEKLTAAGIPWPGTPDNGPNFCDTAVWRFIANGSILAAGTGRWEPLVGYFNGLQRLRPLDDSTKKQKLFLAAVVASLGRVGGSYQKITTALDQIQQAKAEFDRVLRDDKAPPRRTTELLNLLIRSEGEPLGENRRPASVGAPAEVQGGSLFDNLDVLVSGFARDLQGIPFESGELKGKVSFVSEGMVRLVVAGQDQTFDWQLVRALWTGEDRDGHGRSVCTMARPNTVSRIEGTLDKLDDRWGMGLCSVFFDARDILNDVNQTIRRNPSPNNTVNGLLANLAHSDKAVFAFAPAPVLTKPVAAASTKPRPVASALAAARPDDFAKEFDGAMRSGLAKNIDEQIVLATKQSDGAKRLQYLQVLKSQLVHMKVTRSAGELNYTLVNTRGASMRYSTLATVAVPPPDHATKVEGRERAQTALLNIFENPILLEDWLRQVLGTAALAEPLKKN